MRSINSHSHFMKITLQSFPFEQTFRMKFLSTEREREKNKTKPHTILIQAKPLNAFDRLDVERKIQIE